MILGLFWGLFMGDSGDFRVRVEESGLLTIGRGWSAALQAHPGKPIPPAPYS